MMKKISIGIADTCSLVLFGLQKLIEKNDIFDIVFAVPDIDSIFCKLKESPVDILICEYIFDEDPLADGAVLLDKIKRMSPETKILVLSSYTYSDVVLSVIEAGISGFIDKKDTLISIETALTKVNHNEIYLSTSISNKLINGLFIRKNNQANKLTKRELEVVRLFCEGANLSQIASRLNRSPKTISNQKNTAMKKLGATNDINLVEIMRKKLGFLD